MKRAPDVVNRNKGVYADINLNGFHLTICPSEVCYPQMNTDKYKHLKAFIKEPVVLFDTTFGNTRSIANAIAQELGNGATAVETTAFDLRLLVNTSLIVVGSPIIAWKPSARMELFLAGLKNNQLQGIKAAAFDTRVKLFIHGDAATKISIALQTAGAEIITNPQSFYVRGKEGPLYMGEVEKAIQWAKLIKTKI